MKEDNQHVSSQTANQLVSGTFAVTVVSVEGDDKPVFTIMADGISRRDFHRTIRNEVFSRHGRQSGGVKHSWSAVQVDSLDDR